MKKLTSVILILALLLALFAACSGSGNEPAPSGPDSSQMESSGTEPTEQQETVVVTLVLDSTAITSEMGPI